MSIKNNRILNYLSIHLFNKHLIDIHYIPKTDSKIYLTKKEKRRNSQHIKDFS